MKDTLTYSLAYGTETISSADGAFCHISDDTSVTYEKANDGCIFEKKLEGSVTFFDTAFDMLESVYNNAASGFFYFSLYDGNTSVFNGRFSVKDCEMDFDSRSFTASMTDAASRYSDIKTVLNKEQNILALGASSKIGVRWYDATQLTMLNSEVAVVISNGTAFNVDITKATAADLTDTAKNGFRTSTIGNRIYKVSYAEYSRSDYYEQSDDVIVSKANSRYMVRFSENYSWTGSTWKTTITATYIIQSSGASGGTSSTRTKTYTAAAKTTWKDHLADFYLTEVSTKTDIYIRTLTRAARYSDSKVRTDDDVDSDTTFNYHRPGGSFPYVATSTRLTDTVNEYGVNSDGKYYLPPDDTYDYFAFCQDVWTDSVSYWIRQPMVGLTTYESVKVHATNLLDVVTKMVAQAGLTLQLFGADCPISTAKPLYIIPNSNIKAFPYSHPASVLKTTLKKLLTTVCNIFNMDYYIDGNKLMLCSKFQTLYACYSGKVKKAKVSDCQLDLTKLYDNGAHQLLGTGQNTVKMDTDFKLSYSFSYSGGADDGGPFDNSQLTCTDSMAADGSDETVDFGCDADINRMFLSPSDFSDSGFVIVETSNLNVPTAYIAGLGYVQNGHLSMSYIATYYDDCMPNRGYEMDGTSYTCYYSAAFHSLEYKVPLEVPAIDIFKPVSTKFGVCRIEKVSINITSFVADLTLKF